MSSEAETPLSAQNLDYINDLWFRLGVTHDSGKPPEEWPSQITRLEIKQINDPLFISQVRQFLDQKLKEKLDSGEFLKIHLLLAYLLQSPLANEAKGLLIELFKRPKMTVTLRVCLTEAATWGRASGMNEYVLPLFSNRNHSHRATEYLTACPDPAAVDALGQFFLEQSEAGRVSQFDLDAMMANISPRLLKYVVPVLEKERQGKSESDIHPRLSALYVMRKIGDKSVTPLVMKELQNYSDRDTMRACLFTLAKLADEQAYDLFIKSLSQYIKKYYEAVKNQSSSGEVLFVSIWPYFQKLGRDKTPEVVALLQRFAVPQVWKRVSEEDRQFFEESYKGLANFPDSDALRQRLTNIYRDSARPMPERVSAFDELLATFREGTREEIVKRYVWPESETVEPASDLWFIDKNVQIANLHLVRPDGSKWRIRISRSEKENLVIGIFK